MHDPRTPAQIEAARLAAERATREFVSPEFSAFALVAETADDPARLVAAKAAMVAEQAKQTTLF